jgi:hypothetical protein
MASTYVNNLRLNEMGTGDASGTWGNTTNTNLELIGEAFGYGTRAIANASTDNITIADGASDADRSMYLKLTGGGQACTVTLLPNTVSKVWIIENTTNSTLTFTQGSGANVAILTGETKAIATDGGGSGAIVYEVFDDLSLASPRLTGTPTSTTANAGTDTTQVATTAFVKTAVDNAEPFPQGTSMLFQQTSAPTGWTKQTTHNDKAIRLQTGTVGTGGSVAFSTAMATPAVAGGSVSGDPGSNLAVAAGNLAVSMSGNVSNTTLSTSQIPSHSHQSRMFTPGNQGVMAYNYYFPAAAFASTQPNYAAGSGGSHNHGHNISGSMTGAPSLSGNVTSGNLAVGASTATINLQYVDFIIANKD